MKIKINLGDNDRYTSIDEPNHRYITYLVKVLIIFIEWHDNICDGTEFIPNTLYKSPYLLVYGIKDKNII